MITRGGASSVFRSSRPKAVPFVGAVVALHRLLPFLLLSLGCNKLLAKDEPRPAPEGAEPAKKDAPAVAAPSAAAPRAGTHDGRAARYGVPFAWVTSPDEPLARARTFMAEVLSTNTTFMGQGKAHFAPFAEGEKPRATVLACADSRLQASAWDSTPENDDYTVRNFGNQLATSLGSVEYGVEELHTPVLLIIGHTGCDAVKTVMNAAVKSQGALGEELSRMKLAERRRGGDSGAWDSLTSAVVANVDAQVSEAVAHFSPFVQSGELTVVGAVYDVLNQFGAGHGRLRIVNVNSNTEEERIHAFVEALALSEKAASPSTTFASRRAPLERDRALLDGSQRLLPGGPRATVNAVSVLGGGGFDAVSGGTLRPSRKTSGSLVPGTTDLKRAPGASRYANVGRSASSAEVPAHAATGQGETSHASGGGHEPAPAAPAKRGLAIPGAAHDATPPAQRQAAAGH